ncbi:MAG: N-6 DNA methylase [Desulfurococcaceae archaeon]
MASTRISHLVISNLYQVVKWYLSNAVGYSHQVKTYYDMWKSLHALSVNISDEGWNEIRKTAKNIEIYLRSRDDDWVFLFSLETYMHLLVRALTASKLRKSPQNLAQLEKTVQSMRNIFTPSVFEWVFLAYKDPNLNSTLRNSLVQSVDFMLSVIYSLNVATLTVDVFREIYQNILPRELRRSLGEFYTREEIVDEVLDAVGLTESGIKDLYLIYQGSKSTSGELEKPVVLDPACGSGSFLVRVARRMFKALGCKPDIAEFVEETLVGVDINPFAVEMAKLNLILAISDEMLNTCRASYVPSNIRVYWADSLAVVKTNKNVLGGVVQRVHVPSLAQIQGTSSIPVPSLPGLKLEDLLDLIYRGIEQNASFEDLLEDIASKTDPTAVERVKNELRELHSILRSIVESMGNSRIVEFVKNVLAVASLIGKCNYVIGNPPWVRIHGVAKHVMQTLENNYAYYGKGSAYDPKFKMTKTPFKEQHDYSLAFVERGLQFLREGGVLGYVITSKVLKTLYAGRMREDILLNCKVLKLVDYSLYPVPLFQDVVNYPLIIAVKKEKPEDKHEVNVKVYNTVGDSKTFKLPQNELPLDQYDKKSPWVLAPLEVIRALRKVYVNSLRLGDVYRITRGIETSADKIFVGKLDSCRDGIAKLVLGGNKAVDIEVDLLQPFVRGRGVDPFRYEFDEYIVFTHDTVSFDPIWDADQKRVLSYLGLLSEKVKAEASGSALVYTVKTACSSLDQKVKVLNNLGFAVNPVSPCATYRCYEIKHGGARVLRVNLESAGQQECRVYVEGLRIPGKPYATSHFLSSLDKLVGRKNYKSNKPPWALFAVSPDKFRDYRVAWQEIAKHFEACILPVKTKVSICGTDRDVILVPNVKVYFIVEPDKNMALKLLLYLNSGFARSILKLRAWSDRGGYYEHQSTSVAHLPIPRALLECNAWKIVEEVLVSRGEDLNAVAEEILRKHGSELEDELKKVLGLTDGEYKAIVEYGTWLNELGEAKVEGVTEEEMEEEEEGEEEEVY